MIKPEAIPRCGATTKRSGKPCQGSAMENGRCRVHGGSTPSGAAASRFKTGLYSKSLPTRLASRYMEALEDAELIELRRETALVTALVDETLAKLDTGETGALWLRLRTAWSEYLGAEAKDKAVRLAEVGQLIEAGAREAEAVRELRSVISDKARLAESERRRLVEASQVITAEQMVALVATLAAAVVDEVVDREKRARILERFDRALSAGA